MKEAEKRIANEKIAELLGFTRYFPPVDNRVPVQWVYPDDWKEERVSIPCTYIPDFIGMIEKARGIKKMFEYGIPKQHNSRNFSNPTNHE